METGANSQCYPLETNGYENIIKPGFSRFFGSSFLFHLFLVSSFMVVERHMSVTPSYTMPMDIEIHDMEMKKSEPPPAGPIKRSMPAPAKPQVARFVPPQPATSRIETRQTQTPTPQVVQPASASADAAPVYAPSAPAATQVSGPAVPGYGGTGTASGSGGGSSSGGGNGKIQDLSFGSGNGPSFVSRAPVHYPLAARRMGREGKVVLRLTLDDRGKLLKVDVLENPGYGFADAAVEAIKKSHFSPGRSNDKPVACRARLPIRFTLQEG